MREVYERALGATDPDALHDVLVARGPEILHHTVPYIVWAATRKRRKAYAKELRRAVLRNEKLRPAPASVWDPYDRILHDERLLKLADAMSELPAAEVHLLWARAEGKSYEDIAAGWPEEFGDPPLVTTLRQRWRRAIGKLKVQFQSRAK